MRFLLAVAPVLLLASLASAQPLPSDPRIQLVAYDPEQVVTLDVALGYAAVIEISPDETVENVVIGNAGVWQISETGRGSVVVKPLADATPTNLVLLTDRRRYVFQLQPGYEGQSSFLLRFSYPAGTPASSRAATYRMTGDRQLYPIAMYDNGKQTIVTWARQASLPAVFTLEGRQEAVVNGRMVGNNYVIEGTASRYRFRFGAAEAIATRRIVRLRR